MGRTTRVQEENLRIARTPTLVVEQEGVIDKSDPQWFYRLRNDGPADLDSVTVHPPDTHDSVTYPLAAVGEGGFVDGPLRLGSLPIGAEHRFSLGVGPSPDGKCPAFRVRVVATKAMWTWPQVLLLPEPPPRIFIC